MSIYTSLATYDIGSGILLISPLKLTLNVVKSVFPKATAVKVPQRASHLRFYAQILDSRTVEILPTTEVHRTWTKKKIASLCYQNVKFKKFNKGTGKLEIEISKKALVALKPLAESGLVETTHYKVEQISTLDDLKNILHRDFSGETEPPIKPTQVENENDTQALDNAQLREDKKRETLTDIVTRTNMMTPNTGAPVVGGSSLDIDEDYFYDNDVELDIEEDDWETEDELEEVLIEESDLWEEIVDLGEVEPKTNPDTISFAKHLNKLTASLRKLKVPQGNKDTKMWSTQEEDYLKQHINTWLEFVGLRTLDLTKTQIRLRYLATVGDSLIKAKAYLMFSDTNLAMYLTSNREMATTLVRMGVEGIFTINEHLAGTIFEVLYACAVLQNNNEVVDRLTINLLGRTPDQSIVFNP